MIVLDCKGILTSLRKDLPVNFHPVVELGGIQAMPFVSYDTLTREFYGTKRGRDSPKAILAKGYKLHFSSFS
jgi:hypothetical protein